MDSQTVALIGIICTILGAFIGFLTFKVNVMLILAVV